MPFLRALRVKTLLLAIPMIIFLLYYSSRRQQLPALTSFVPNIHPTHNSSHAAQSSEYESQSPNVEPAHPPPPPPPTLTPTSSHTSTIAVKEPKQSEQNPAYTQKQAQSLTISASAFQPTISQIVDASASKHNLSTITDSTSSNNTLTHNINVTLQQQSISMANDLTMRKAQIKFWRSFLSLLVDSKPDSKPPKRIINAEAQGFNPSDSQIVRPEVLEMSNEDLEKMRKAHSKFVDAIKKDQLEMPFTPASRGLVSTAGGKYLPVFVVSLRMLRRTGTTLPMEVFLADHEEYEKDICEDVLPSLNATCVLLSDIFDRVPHSGELAKYQFKVFAMIFSSFEEMLFLDADAFPIHNPELLFSSELFKKYYLISWPDYWASSTSPFFYNITQQKIPLMKDRASSETGELLLSKKTHQPSLLLAAYYNYYGPSHYYPLLSQGAPGEGDKETFLAAANVMNQSFYATSERVQTLGHMKDGKFTDGSAMIQHDPIEDFKLTQQGLWRVKDPQVAKPPRPFFIHAHYPKFDPATIFQLEGPTKDSNGDDRKAWTDDKRTVVQLGKDLEKHFWEEIKWTSCNLEHKFKTWRNVEGICKNATTYWNNLFA